MAETDETAPPKKRSRLTEIMASHDFLRDILVTTIGVLLALAIGEVADDWRQKRKAREAEAAMRRDAIVGQTAAGERVLIGRCVERRLAALRAIIDEGRASGRLPAIAEVGRPGGRPKRTTAFDVAVGQGLVVHLDPERAERYAFIFNSNRKMDELQEGELDVWNVLRLLQGRGGPWPTALEADLLKAHVLAEDRNRFVSLVARQIVRASFELRIPVRGFSNRPLDWDEAVANVLDRPICKPLMVDGKPYRLPA